MPMVLGLAQILFVGLVVFWVWLVVYTVYALRHPPRRTYAWAVSRNVPGDPGECDGAYKFETFEVTGTQGTIVCWRVEGRDPDGPCVVMTHGWGSSKIGGLVRLKPVVEHAREVIVWDLPGHGESDGLCVLGAHEHRDLLAIIDTIEPGVPVVLYGWSMGAGVGIKAGAEMADRSRLAGVVCESAYVHARTPAGNVIRLRGFPTRFNLPPAMALLGIRFGIGASWRGFARDKLASRLGDVEMLVVHGVDDPVCPIADGEAIASAAGNGKLVRIEGGGHNNLWTDERFAEQMSNAVGAFLVRLQQK